MEAYYAGISSTLGSGDLLVVSLALDGVRVGKRELFFACCFFTGKGLVLLGPFHRWKMVGCGKELRPRSKKQGKIANGHGRTTQQNKSKTKTK